MENLIGPILTDAEFFEALDYEKYPEISGAKTAADKGDFATARSIFVKFARASLDPEKFFSRENRVMKPDFTAGTKEKAERAIKHLMISCGTPYQFGEKVDWLSNHGILEYKEWPWQLSRHDELVGLARAYRASGDQRYADGCAELLNSWIKQAVRPDLPCPSGATLAWRTIECGIRMGLMWPEIIHTFINNEAFTDDLIVDFYKSVYEHSVSMLHRFTRGNWLIHELNGLGQSGIFYPVFKDSQMWFEVAFRKIEEELRENQVHPDGFQFELSVGYHGVVIHHCMEVMEVAKDYGREVPQSFYDAIENMLMLYIRLKQSSNLMPHGNDGGGGNYAGLIKRYGAHFPNNEYFKWVLSDGKEGKKPNFKSLKLENCGLITLRTDWECETSAFFDTGNFGAAHQHEDKLNLVISNDTKAILCEANTYAYDTSESRRYCLDSRGHNVIRINGLNQNRRETTVNNTREMLFGIAPDVTLYTTEAYDYAAGVYDGAFGKEKTYPARHERSVIYLKKPKQGLPLYIVTDRLLSENINSYESIWHFDTENEALDGYKFTSDDISMFICGDTGNIEMVKGVEAPVYQGWIFRTSKQGSQVPIPTILHTVNGTNITTITVFSIHKNGETPVESISTDGNKVIVQYKNGETDTVCEADILAENN